MVQVLYAGAVVCGEQVHADRCYYPDASGCLYCCQVPAELMRNLLERCALLTVQYTTETHYPKCWVGWVPVMLAQSMAQHAL